MDMSASLQWMVCFLTYEMLVIIAIYVHCNILCLLNDITFFILMFFSVDAENIYIPILLSSHPLPIYIVIFMCVRKVTLWGTKRTKKKLHGRYTVISPKYLLLHVFSLSYRYFMEIHLKAKNTSALAFYLVTSSSNIANAHFMLFKFFCFNTLLFQEIQ